MKVAFHCQHGGKSKTQLTGTPWNNHCFSVGGTWSTLEEVYFVDLLESSHATVLWSNLDRSVSRHNTHSHHLALIKLRINCDGRWQKIKQYNWTDCQTENTPMRTDREAEIMSQCCVVLWRRLDLVKLHSDVTDWLESLCVWLQANCRWKILSRGEKAIQVLQYWREYCRCSSSLLSSVCSVCNQLIEFVLCGCYMGSCWYWIAVCVCTLY